VCKGREVEVKDEVKVEVEVEVKRVSDLGVGLVST
jgi:hypothetical protein